MQTDLLLRYGLELTDVTNLFAGTTISAFAETVAKDGKVQAMNAKGLGGLNAKEFERLEEEAMKMGAKVRRATCNDIIANAYRG